MLRIFQQIFLGFIVSLYFFPFGFTFLPEGFNTKIGLAAFGVLCFCLDLVKRRKIAFNSLYFPIFLLLLLYCLVGYISVDLNNTNDYTYASYFISFFTWLFGAFATVYLLRPFHRVVDFKLITNYLLAVCLVQCGLALLIDNYAPLKIFVDAYIDQSTVAETQFLNEVERLYGIGAALDVAGTRFSIVLLAVVAVITTDKSVKENTFQVFLYWIGFLLLAFIGNLISRTTTIGLGLGLAYFIAFSGIHRIQIEKSTIRVWGITLVTVFLILVLANYLYRTDPYFHEQMRYGFEGFFNWLEKGEWRTDSTDKLNKKMWIWPTNTRTWLIGDGTWAQFGSDIGYCRFVFYNGLIGLTLFSLYFAYNALIGIIRFPSYRNYFILLLGLTFIIWAKVPTDLFIIYALYYWIDSEKEASL